MFAAIRIPDFPLAAVLRRMEKPLPPAPRALAVSGEKGSVLECIDQAARAQGISPGMSTTRALARCGSLSIVEKDERAEQSAMRWLVALGFGLAPCVEVTKPGWVTVDLEGVRDLSATAATLVERAGQSAMPVSVGISNTPERAYWASWGASIVTRAETDEELFGGLAPSKVPLPAEIRRSLKEWGMNDLLAFVRLEKEDIGRRLGPEGVALWEAMKGRRSRLLKRVVGDPVFQSEMEMDQGLETLEQALFVIRRLLEEVCAALEAAGRVARSLELSWRTEEKARGGHGFTLPEATARVAPLFAMIESYLSGVRTDSPLRWIGLEAEPGDPLPRQRDFFEISGANPFRFQETLGRVQGFLGEEKVGMPVRGTSHPPDVYRLEPPTFQFRVEEEDSLYRREMGPSLRRFRPPRPVQVWCEGGLPVRLSWGRRSYTLHAVRGPWRISGDWWDAKARWSREEWDVQSGRNTYCRIVRFPAGHWLWEGVYD